MAERPILFSGPMVRAILAGLKTVTRRIPSGDAAHLNADPDRWRSVRPLMESEPIRDGGAMQFPGTDYRSWIAMADPAGIGNSDWFVFGLPWGVGDLLWVREAWQQFFDDEMPPERPRGPIGTMGSPAAPHRASRVFYRADGDPRPHSEYGSARWIPSIHMPRWASRLALEVVSIRIERLQDITEEDARAEGVEAISIEAVPRNAVWSCRQDFAQLWDRINGKRGSWESNLWVPRIEFRRVEVADA